MPIENRLSGTSPSGAQTKIFTPPTPKEAAEKARDNRTFRVLHTQVGPYPLNHVLDKAHLPGICLSDVARSTMSEKALDDFADGVIARWLELGAVECANVTPDQASPPPSNVPEGIAPVVFRGQDAPIVEAMKQMSETTKAIAQLAAKFAQPSQPAASNSK